jgi:hypothetical protein
MRALLAVSFAVAAAAGLAACGTAAAPSGETASPGDPDPASRIDVATTDAILGEAFEDRAEHLQVLGAGTVIRVLEDDDDGSRHQRFIVRLSSGQTLLIAHNVDLARRVRGLRVRDRVSFFGEYEWNDEGGTIHWTHDDPQGEHVAGWLYHRGRVYQ